MINFIDPRTDSERYSLDDLGIGNAFADSVKNDLRYVSDERCWRFFNGKRWVKDFGGLSARELGKSYQDFLRKLVKNPKTDEDKELKALANQLAENKARKRMLDEAMSVHPLSKSDFDKKKNLFNCNNGTIDLETGELQQHSAEDYLTKIALVNYNRKLSVKRWNKFISEIMCHDEEAMKFLQKAFAYGITGETNLECLFILFGEKTRNGKGTLVESCVNILGDYALNMQPDSLAKRGGYSGSRASPDIARNVGVRFVSVNEPPHDMVFDAAIVKQLTGSDTVTARFLYGNSFDFKPQFKFYISTNYLPTITDDTLFASGRINVIPFKRHFSDKDQDKSLKSLFRTEDCKSAILNWLLDGLALYRIEGLIAPASIIEATSTYRNTTDTVGLFIKEAVTNNSKADHQKTSLVHKTYADWCEEKNLTPVDLKKFVSSMRSAGYVKRDAKLGNVIFGATLKCN